MDLEDQYRFQVDAVYSGAGELYVTLECQRCPWIVEPEAPVTIAELNQRADEHTEVCR